MFNSFYYTSILFFLLIANSSCQNNSKYTDDFELVWNTINDNFYDPSFERIDWNSIYDKYKPIILDVSTDSVFYDQINRMLFELKVSHTGVIPPGYLPKVEPTTFAEGSTGIDVRVLYDQAIITDVRKNSSADSSGIIPSFVLTAINGKSIEQIANERLNLLEPPFNKTHSITSEIQSRLYGDVGSPVEIKYRDNEGIEFTEVVERTQRNEIVNFGEGFPSSVIEFDASLIEENIGYIRFNWFYPTISKDFAKVLQNFKNTKGLIIDLRGNPGGERNDVIAIAEMFVEEQTLAYSEQLRTGKSKIFLNPVPDPFRGDVIILVDIMSKSSSECLAGCLQSINRGLIIGEQTPGSVGPADFIILPNGATFIYPYAKTILVDGKVIEGNGIIPDIRCDIDLKDLADGKDTQLERAVNYLIKSTGEENG
jgi:C-terminal peptidase prc